MAKPKLAETVKSAKNTPQIARQGEKLWCIAQINRIYQLLNLICTYGDVSMELVEKCNNDVPKDSPIRCCFLTHPPSEKKWLAPNEAFLIAIVPFFLCRTRHQVLPVCFRKKLGWLCSRKRHHMFKFNRFLSTIWIWWRNSKYWNLQGFSKRVYHEIGMQGRHLQEIQTRVYRQKV